MAITVLAAVMSQGATVLMESFTDAHAGILAASGASWENLSETAFAITAKSTASR